MLLPLALLSSSAILTSQEEEFSFEVVETEGGVIEELQSIESAMSSAGERVATSSADAGTMSTSTSTSTSMLEWRLLRWFDAVKTVEMGRLVAAAGQGSPLSKMVRCLFSWFTGSLLRRGV